MTLINLPPPPSPPKHTRPRSQPLQLSSSSTASTAAHWASHQKSDMAIVLSPPFPSSTRLLFLHVAKKKGKSSRARKEQQILSFLDRMLDDLHNFWERLQRIRAYVRWPRLEQFVSVAYRRGGGARLLQLQWAMGVRWWMTKRGEKKIRKRRRRWKK